MCGIVGIVYRDRAAEEPVLRRAADTLARRGPDGGGVWVEGGVGLGHRRLAVLDVTETGHQPMVSSDGRFVVVYNGEIYNFEAIRADLTGEGTSWRSTSDTEVLLEAYRRWGRDCLARFHGMFAFAIWDREARSLFLARDRMGVKPLYYAPASRAFAFASRPRALWALDPGFGSDLDEQALRLYLEGGYVPAPYSIQTGIRKLPPGHYALLDDGGLRVERYWDFRQVVPDPARGAASEEELLDELEAILDRSVRLRMVSDVPLGAFLSGGIDSSLVLALMQRHAGGQVDAFTIGFHPEEFDESTEAQAVAEHLGSRHHVERLEVEDLLKLLPTFMEEYDEPLFDSSAFPVMALSRMARRQVTVAVSGDGGDEMFGGYHYYQIAKGLNPIYALPQVVRRALAGGIGALPSHRLKLLAGAIRQPDAVSGFAYARSISKDFAAVLDQDVLSRTFGLKELFGRAAAGFPADLTVIDVLMRLDASYTLPDDYLQKVDVASMAFSLEVREPLLDHSVVEWAMGLPVHWKFRGAVGKYLLRRLAYRFVPRELLDRPKKGFSVPIDHWLRGPLREWAEATLSRGDLYERLPLRREGVRRLFDLHLSGQRNVHPLLWGILMLMGFADRWRAGVTPPA